MVLQTWVLMLPPAKGVSNNEVGWHVPQPIVCVLLVQAAAGCVGPSVGPSAAQPMQSAAIVLGQGCPCTFTLLAPCAGRWFTFITGTVQVL